MSTKLLKTPEEIAKSKAKRKEYIKQYQRNYYTNRKNEPDFKEQRRIRSKDAYAYTRRTIDCTTCGIRHRSDSQNCLLIQKSKQNKNINFILDALDTKPTE